MKPSITTPAENEKFETWAPVIAQRLFENTDRLREFGLDLYGAEDNDKILGFFRRFVSNNQTMRFEFIEGERSYWSFSVDMPFEKGYHEDEAGNQYVDRLMVPRFNHAASGSAPMNESLALLKKVLEVYDLVFKAFEGVPKNLYEMTCSAEQAARQAQEIKDRDERVAQKVQVWLKNNEGTLEQFLRGMRVPSHRKIGGVVEGIFEDLSKIFLETNQESLTFVFQDKTYEFVRWSTDKVKRIA